MAREYDIAKASGTCARCGKELASGAEFLAVLSESPEGPCVASTPVVTKVRVSHDRPSDPMKGSE